MSRKKTQNPQEIELFAQVGHTLQSEPKSIQNAQQLLQHGKNMHAPKPKEIHGEYSDAIIRWGDIMCHAGVQYVEFLGILTLLSAAVLCCLNMTMSILNKQNGWNICMILGTGEGKRKATMIAARLQLGTLTAMGLNILVVSDVLETLTKSSDDYEWAALGKIGAIAAFRTALAYFLGLEVHEVMEEEKQEAEHEHLLAAEEIDQHKQQHTNTNKKD